MASRRTDPRLKRPSRAPRTMAEALFGSGAPPGLTAPDSEFARLPSSAFIGGGPFSAPDDFTNPMQAGPMASPVNREQAALPGQASADSGAPRVGGADSFAAMQRQIAQAFMGGNRAAPFGGVPLDDDEFRAAVAPGAGSMRAAAPSSTLRAAAAPAPSMRAAAPAAGGGMNLRAATGGGPPIPAGSPSSVGSMLRAGVAAARSPAMSAAPAVPAMRAAAVGGARLPSMPAFSPRATPIVPTPPAGGVVPLNRRRRRFGGR